MLEQGQLFQPSDEAILLQYKIVSKLCVEDARDLSDETIKSVFENTCLPKKLISYAKELRDYGVITNLDLTK